MNTKRFRDEAEWEANGELLAGRPPSIVVSVRFPAEDIEHVREAARRLGETTSEFIRRSALDAATLSGSMTLKVAPIGITLLQPVTETRSTAPAILVRPPVSA